MKLKRFKKGLLGFLFATTAITSSVILISSCTSLNDNKDVSEKNLVDVDPNPKVFTESKPVHFSLNDDLSLIDNRVIRIKGQIYNRANASFGFGIVTAKSKKRNKVIDSRYNFANPRQRINFDYLIPEAILSNDLDIDYRPRMDFIDTGLNYLKFYNSFNTEIAYFQGGTFYDKHVEHVPITLINTDKYNTYNKLNDKEDSSSSFGTTIKEFNIYYNKDEHEGSFKFLWDKENKSVEIAQHNVISGDPAYLLSSKYSNNGQKSILDLFFEKHILNEQKDTKISINKSVFSNKKINSDIILSTISNIGAEAFKNNDISSVIFSNDLKEISSEAFQNNKIESFIMPDSLETIGESAFSSNLITELKIGQKLSSISKEAFKSNNLSNFFIPINITQIHESAFYENPNLKIVEVSGLYLNILKDSAEQVQKIFNSEPEIKGIDVAVSYQKIEYEDEENKGSFAFKTYKDYYLIVNVTSQKGDPAYLFRAKKDSKETNLITLMNYYVYDFSNNNKPIKLDTGIMMSSNIENEVIIPERVNEIMDFAFADNKITGLSIPNSLTTIGERAFIKNNIKDIDIPANVLTVKREAFDGEVNLTYDGYKVDYLWDIDEQNRTVNITFLWDKELRALSTLNIPNLIRLKNMDYVVNNLAPYSFSSQKAVFIKINPNLKLIIPEHLKDKLPEYVYDI